MVYASSGSRDSFKPNESSKKLKYVIESPDAKRAASVKTTAGILGCSEAFVRRLIADGQLEAVRHRGRVFIPTESIDGFLGGAK
jgi:excisionase family DNA binding protein